MKRHLCIFLLLMFCCHTMTAERKHALIFGLGIQQDKCWTKIHGDKDVEIVKKMLSECGFKDIRTIINEQATKQGMARAFIDLAKNCKKGDVVYIHYSGHGQLMTDIDGDEAERWTGKHAQWDESWIPYDAYMYYGEKDRGEKHFSDDEIARYLNIIRDRIGSPGKLYVIVDACHSGDATKGNDDECVRGVDIEFRIPKQITNVPYEPIQEKWLTISACKPYQLCFEQKSPIAGKLTFAIFTIGKELFNMSNTQIQKALQKYMDEHPARLPQNPVVSGKK